MGDFDLGGFELINFVIDLAEIAQAGGVVVAAIGGFGDLAQGIEVDIGGGGAERDIAGAVSERLAIAIESCGVGDAALLADPDGVDPDIVGFGGFGGGDGLELAAIIGPIGEEDEDAGIGFEVAEAPTGAADGATDGGPVLNLADAEVGEASLEPLVVEGEGADEVRLGGEGEEADAIGLTLVDKVAHDGADGGEAIDADAIELKIVGPHGGGQIDGEEDIEAAGLGGSEFLTGLGAGEGEDEEGDGEPAHGGAPVAGAVADKSGQLGGQPGGGKAEGTGAAEPPDEEEASREEGEKEQESRVCEAEDHGWAGALGSGGVVATGWRA